MTLLADIAQWVAGWIWAAVIGAAILAGIAGAIFEGLRKSRRG